MEIAANNRRKAHILQGDEPFLRLLDVSDANGRVHDKKQAKFRQINRFLELIRDCLPALPQAGELRVCDLCCGKSYLSFAAYHYFANVLGRTVRMTGVDLKPDVIDRCNLAARALGWGADAILSTPCCHHELNHTLNCPALGFIGAHSMLRQKLCDAATDALRLKYLEASGYSVAALELIDPEETPKNILLRGLRDRSFDPQSDRARRLWAEYETAKRFLVGENAHVQEALSPQTETEQPRLSS